MTAVDPTGGAAPSPGLAAPELALRTAGPDDAPALAALAEHVFRDTFGPHNTAEDMDAYCRAAFAIDHVRHELTDREYHTVLAIAHGELAGYAQLRATAPPPCVTGPAALDPTAGSAPRPAGEAVGVPTPRLAALELKRLYVDRRWHGGGLAAALLDRAIAIAVQRGARTLYLSVWQHNHRAIAFYAKHGFVRVGVAEFTLGRDVQLDPVMVRPLPAVAPRG
jgi:ribosomal protein S18 acetylase RimI-like enzyme